MSEIRKIYNENQANLLEAAESFIKSPRNIGEEINALVALLETPDYEKALVVFYLRILLQITKKEKELTRLISALLLHLDSAMSYKNSVFILTIIGMLLNTRLYIPLTYYITKVLETAIVQKKLSVAGKKYSYENIRLSSDDLKAEELQLYVVSECLSMIRKHVHLFGNNIGFPELAFVVCSELRRCCKVGVFKEAVGELIKWIENRKEYVEEARSSAKMETLSGKALVEFEKNLSPWLIEG